MRELDLLIVSCSENPLEVGNDLLLKRPALKIFKLGCAGCNAVVLSIEDADPKHLARRERIELPGEVFSYNVLFLGLDGALLKFCNAI